MRLVLVCFCALCYASLYAQTDTSGFWSFMPDSLHQQRFLKNWQLKGPVKQVVVKEFSYFGREYDYSESNWDGLKVKAVESLYYELNSEVEKIEYDTVIFLPTGEVKAILKKQETNYFASNPYFAFAGWGSNFFDGNYKITYNANGLPKQIVGSNADTLEYHYDKLGRITSMLLSDKYFVNPGELRQYPNDTTVIDLMQPLGIRRPIKLKTRFYNSKGLLLSERRYNEELSFNNINEDDSVYSETVYQYDSARKLVSTKNYVPVSHTMVLGEDGKISDTLVNSKDSTILNYLYNNLGQLIEAETIHYGTRGISWGFAGYNEVDTIGQRSVTSYEYNENGFLAKKSSYIMGLEGEKIWGDVYEYRYSYDSYKNPTKIVHIITQIDYSQVDIQYIQFIEYEYY